MNLLFLHKLATMSTLKSLISYMHSPALQSLLFLYDNYDSKRLLKIGVDAE